MIARRAVGAAVPVVAAVVVGLVVVWLLFGAVRGHRWSGTALTSPAPAPALVDAAGRRYALAAEFDHAAISGLYWAVYRTVGTDGGSPRRPSRTMPKP